MSANWATHLSPSTFPLIQAELRLEHVSYLSIGWYKQISSMLPCLWMPGEAESTDGHGINSPQAEVQRARGRIIIN